MERRQNEGNLVTTKKLATLAERVNATKINYHPDSSQLTVNIVDSQLMERLLKKPITEKPDSVNLVAMELGKQLNELLNQESTYENLYLSFQMNEQQSYSLNFCIRNCK